MHIPHLSGLIAAPYTAFHPDGSLHLAMIARQAKALAASGVTGAFICGTTGEGASLSTAERQLVAEEWVRVRGGLQVLVHVGHTALPEACALAAHAQEIGADRIGCVAPFFFRPPGLEELVAFCARVAEAAPKLPFYYYHIPSMSGVQFLTADFLRAAQGRIPNLAGIKFTHENLMDFAACQEMEGGRYDILFGRDEMLLAGLSLGAQGAIGSTYNFLSPIFGRLLQAFARGNLPSAREEQARANRVIEVFLRHGGLPAGKAIMRFIGLDCGPVRLPLRTLPEEAVQMLQQELQTLGFLN